MYGVLGEHIISFLQSKYLKVELLNQYKYILIL